MTGVLLINQFSAAVAATGTPAPSGSTPFLQAQVSVHSASQGLSRNDLDPGQLSQPVQPTMAAINPTDAQFASVTMQSHNLTANTSNQALESDLSTDVRAREYNVDWSSWISKFADRWYFVLKQYEMAQNAQFVTVRPALFQFTCYTNGTVANVVLKQSSGNVAYDRLQVIALMQAMPAPPFPVGTHRQSITLVQGWESHVRKPGENDFTPGSFGRGFPMEKVKEWVQTN